MRRARPRGRYIAAAATDPCRWIGHWRRWHTLPRQKQAYFRHPWIADFRTDPATHNTMERFVANEEAPVDTDHQP